MREIIAKSADGRFVIKYGYNSSDTWSGDGDWEYDLIDTQSKRVLRTFIGVRVEFSPDGRDLIVISDSKRRERVNIRKDFDLDPDVPKKPAKKKVGPKASKKASKKKV